MRDRDADTVPEAEFVAAYRAVLPQVCALQPFHIAFALFLFGVIFVGIANRAAAGNAANSRRRAMLAEDAPVW